MELFHRARPHTAGGLRYGQSRLSRCRLDSPLRITATALHRDYTWDTTNNLLTKNDHYDGIEGVKTGHTENAGYCLVFEAAHTDRRLVGVVLGEKTDAGRFTDATALLDWGFGAQKAA